MRNDMPPPMSTTANAASRTAPSQPVTGRIGWPSTLDPEGGPAGPAPDRPAPDGPAPDEGEEPGARVALVGSTCGDPEVGGDARCMGAPERCEAGCDAGCESMRKATLASAIVSTMSSANRRNSSRGTRSTSSPHHTRHLPTKIIGSTVGSCRPGAAAAATASAAQASGIPTNAPSIAMPVMSHAT